MAIPPIIGNEVGVFAWYEHGSVFTDGEYADLHAQLSNKSSESPTEYYDGTYAYGENTYFVRIRKDGYILTWLPNTTEAAWDFDFSGDPPLSQRAIQAMMNAAGVSGFSFVKCYYYNFNYPNATGVRWFGMSRAVPDGGTSYYFTVPVETIVHKTSLKYKLCSWYFQPQYRAYLKINGVTIDSFVAPGIEYACAPIKVVPNTDSYLNTKGIENTITHYASNGGSDIAWSVIVIFNS